MLLCYFYYNCFDITVIVIIIILVVVVVYVTQLDLHAGEIFRGQVTTRSLRLPELNLAVPSRAGFCGSYTFL